MEDIAIGQIKQAMKDVRQELQLDELELSFAAITGGIPSCYRFYFSKGDECVTFTLNHYQELVEDADELKDKLLEFGSKYLEN
jgi:hypothetical protein